MDFSMMVYFLWIAAFTFVAGKVFREDEKKRMRRIRVLFESKRAFEK